MKQNEIKFQIRRDKNNDISKIALVIIEKGPRWLVENFVLSRYNHR